MTYIHPDGTQVGTTDTPGEIATWHASADGPGDRQYIHPARAAAIHAAYLDSLGLWLDEETGCLVDTASRSNLSDGTIAYNVLRREPGGHLATDDGWAGQIRPDERDRAVDRYVATPTPPQPEPQPGEVWEVTRAGKKVREVVSASGTHFLGVVDAVHDTCHVGKQGGES